MKNWLILLVLALLAFLAFRSNKIAKAGGSYEPSTGRFYTPGDMARGGLTPTGGLMTVQEAERAYNAGQLDYATYQGVLSAWGVI